MSATMLRVLCSGVVLAQSGHHEEAETLLAEAMHIVEEEIQNEKPGQKNENVLHKAEEYAKRAVELDPANSEVWLGAGDIEHHYGHYSEAEFLLNKAVELAPGSYDASFVMGVSQRIHGNNKGAVDSLQKAIHIDPTKGKAHAAIGTAFMNAGRKKEAENALLHAISLGDIEEPTEKLRKMWTPGAVVPGKCGWDAAVGYENETMAEFPWKESLDILRSKEADADWHHQRYLNCAELQLSVPSFSCIPSAVFFEGFQAGWELVQKHAVNPHGKHVVVGGGLGAFCLFAVKVAGASECHNVERSCWVAEEASKLSAEMSPYMSSTCKDLRLDSADVVWVVDGNTAEETQVDTEQKLGSGLHKGATVVMYRPLKGGNPRLKLKDSTTMEMKCIGWIQSKGENNYEECIRYRAVVSWDDKNAGMGLYEVVHAAEQEL